MAKVIVDIPDEMWNTLQIGQYQMGYAEYVAQYVEKGKLIPSNATNGDVIKAMFPNLKTGADPYIPSVDIYVGGILMMRVDRNWWNAPYKAESEGNK